MHKYAISDIHGCSRTFNALLEKIGLSQSDELYLLGDYIDRGPDSRGVIDCILRLQDDGFQVRCLRGNHEQMLLDQLQYPNFRFDWYANGGVRTLESFEKMAVTAFEDRYLEFFANLGFFFSVDNYLLVHAGLNFNSDDPLEDTISMLWIRQWYEKIDYQWLHNRIIVHGHTPMARETINKQWENLSNLPALNIDGGCVFAGYREGVGYLCAYDLTDNRLIFQENIDG